MRRVLFPSAFSLSLILAAAVGAQDFPAGIEGEIYFCPRIDLAEGGLALDLDGELDEEAWSRAAWHGWTNPSDQARGDPFAGISPEEDLEFEWAALADEEFLYVAWRITDDIKQNEEQSLCDVWRDDSVEVYIDAENDGPECLEPGDAQCYGTDDAQITVGLENDGFGDPELLVFGGVAGGRNCDFAGSHPEVAQGVVQSVTDEDEMYVGWQAEIAIALTTEGNNDDGTPAWAIEPDHCQTIGFNIHGQDDDDGGDRDHKLMWSKKEVTESAWRNPGAFGKLVFIDPTVPVEEGCEITPAVESLTCERNEDGSVSLTWVNPDGANTARPITISVDGEDVATVDGTSESAELTSEQVPLDNTDHEIVVTNSGRQPTKCILVEAPFDECGGIRMWNILGAFTQEGGAAPPVEEIQRDYLTDGEIGELDFEWAPGASIETDFSGAAASIGLDSGNPVLRRNPGGVPTVFTWEGVGSTVDFQSGAAFGRDINNVMNYAQIYVFAEESVEAFLAISSDDSVQVFLNGEEIWVNSIGRPAGSSCSPDDTPFDPVIFEEGENSLMVKVFEGGGGHAFSVAIQDDLLQPFTEGLFLSFSPAGPVGTQFIRGDSTQDGELNITDAVKILGVLFLGDRAPPCQEAMDVNDDGELNITDGIGVLGFLFLGQAAPGQPFPECGLDPEGSRDLGCESHPPCGG